MSPTGPRVAVVAHPGGVWAGHIEWATDAVLTGGGSVTEIADADGLVWLDGSHPQDLAAHLSTHPRVRWVQLPMAGVDRFVDLMDAHRTWTSGKGMASTIVAEHAVALILAGLRRIPQYSRAGCWTAGGARTLAGARVTVVGAGGITRTLLELLAPFGAECTVVRHRPDPVPGAVRVLGTDRLHEGLAGADVVVLALALTEQTRGMIAAAELAAMGPDALLVNVSRGAHVVTDDLVRALQAGVIAGAALDVTDPEPLPAGHPLWTLPTCLITPHVATTIELSRPLLAARIRENVRRLACGEPLTGRVDSTLGY